MRKMGETVEAPEAKIGLLAERPHREEEAGLARSVVAPDAEVRTSLKGRIPRKRGRMRQKTSSNPRRIHVAVDEGAHVGEQLFLPSHTPPAQREARRDGVRRLFSAEYGTRVTPERKLHLAARFSSSLHQRRLNPVAVAAGS